jgi:hypothetical protein
MIVTRDTILHFHSDTSIFLSHDTRYKIKRDKEYRSGLFYENFGEKSEKNILLKGIYSTLIREQSDTTQSGKPEETNNYQPQIAGKSIGRIEVFAVDIISGDVNNPTAGDKSFYVRSLNRLHHDTRESIIRKNLTLKEGDILGAYSISDNEYHLRSLKYIEDARIFTVADSLDPEIINLVVFVKDLFPLTVGIGIGGITNYNLGVNNINIAGSGHELTNSFLYDADNDQAFGYRGELSFNNLWGSFINTHLVYRNDDVETLTKLTGEREFVTPETKYGGGIELFHQNSTLEVETSDTVTVKVPYTKEYFDQWIGRNFLLNQVRRNSIVLKARFMSTLYTSRPTVEADTNQQFYNVYMLLGSITFLKRDHYKERMLLGYGLVEDVNFGYALELTSGYLFNDAFRSPYVGFSFKAAHKFAIGYVGGGFEYGGQLYQQNLVLGLFRSVLTYYSPLVKMRPFDCRFLFRLSYTEGIRRYNYEILDLGKEVRGVSNSGIEGNRRLIARFEAVTFLKGNLIGFRFSPNLFYDAAFIGKGKSLVSSANYFSVAGIGVRIRNENLAFQTLILRAGYYTGNPMKAAHFGAGFNTSTPDVIKDYEISKPDVLRY